MIQNILICGLGAAGSNLIMNLLYDLPEVEIFGIDFDFVEPRNYLAGTQPYMKMHVGKSKTQAMESIAHMFHSKRITGLPKKITSEADLGAMVAIAGKSGPLLIIDAFDNAEARNITKRFFLKNRYKNNVKGLLHLGFSPSMTGEILWDSMWDEITPSKMEFDICTTQGARSFIIFLTSICSLVIQEYNKTEVQQNLYLDKFFNLRKI